MSGEAEIKRQEKKKEVTVTMWVSFQIILDRKDAYPEELMGFVIVIFDCRPTFFFLIGWGPAVNQQKQEQLKLVWTHCWINVLSVKKIPVLNLCVLQASKHD